MIRLFLICLGIAAVAFITVWVADHPGRVVLNWEAYRIETSVAVLVGAVALAAALSIALFEAMRMIWHGPAGFRAARRRRREQRGYRALTLGLVAAAAGDARGARRLSRRADSLLGEPPLTLLLSAQAAQLEGDELALAQRTVEAAATLLKLDAPLLYARADFLRGDDGGLLLTELELVEPSLFFRHDNGAAERLADALLARLT